MIDKTVDCPNPKQKISIPNVTDYYPIHEAYKPTSTNDKLGKQLLSGVMTLVMGIMTMVRITNNMPKRLTDATLYSHGIHDDDNIVNKQKFVSTSEYLSMMRRMGELEEKVIALENQPIEMPPEKEDMLNKALSRVEALEMELAATKKVTLQKIQMGGWGWVMRQQQSVKF